MRATYFLPASPTAIPSLMTCRSVGNARRLFVEKIDALGRSNTGIESVVKNEGHILPARLTHGDALAYDVHEAEVNKLQDVLVEGIIVPDFSKKGVLPLLLDTEVFHTLKRAREVSSNRSPWDVYLRISEVLAERRTCLEGNVCNCLEKQIRGATGTTRRHPDKPR